MTQGGAVRRARSCALMCLLVLIRVAEYTPRVCVVKKMLDACGARQKDMRLAENVGSGDRLALEAG